MSALTSIQTSASGRTIGSTPQVRSHHAIIVCNGDNNGVPIWLRIGDTSGILPARKKPAGPVWLIAESSSGLGLALAKAVLRQGHRAIPAAHNTAAVQDLADAFPDAAFVAALDGTKPDDIARIVQEAKDRFGSVDVLVNTSGVGYITAAEDEA